MKYRNTVQAVFVRRLNRFVALAELDGREERVHVKNTGRLKELLRPGAAVTLAGSDDPARKTRYDLVAAERPGLGWVNVDSQAPNRIVWEWLSGQGFDRVQPEYTVGESRFDFMMVRGNERFLLEVKGCTLERDGVGYFPDAPTERGVRHLRELARLTGEGWRCHVGFVIQMNGIREVRPNDETHPAFGEALRAAAAAGVVIHHWPCCVTADSLSLDEKHCPSLLQE